MTQYKFNLINKSIFFKGQYGAILISAFQLQA